MVFGELGIGVGTGLHGEHEDGPGVLTAPLDRKPWHGVKKESPGLVARPPFRTQSFRCRCQRVDSGPWTADLNPGNLFQWQDHGAHVVVLEAKTAGFDKKLLGK